MPSTVTIKKQDVYYIGLSLYVLALNIQYSYAHNEWVLSNSPMLTILALIRYAALTICITHFLTIRKMSTRTMIAILALFVLALYAVHTGPQRAPLFYFIVLVTGVQTDFRKSVKMFLKIQVATFILYLTLSAVGIMGDSVVESFGRTRSFLGYGWVNRASYCFFFICLEILYLNRNRIKLKQGILLSVVNTYVFIRTNTVFSMLMTFCVIGYGVWNDLSFRIRGAKKREKDNAQKRKSVFAISFFLLTIIIGVGLPLVYNPGNPVMYQLNRMVTGRLALGKTAIARYGLHLGGNKLQWVGSSTLMFGLSKGTEYFYVDNAFLQLALEFGLLFASLIVAIYLFSIKKAIDLGNYELVAIFLILGVLFIFEPYMIDFAFNPFILYFFSTISLDRVKESIKMGMKTRIISSNR